MNKRKQKSRPRERPIKDQSIPPRDKLRFWTIGRKIGGIFVFLLSLLGFLIFWPKISVFSSDSIDPLRPLETPFIVKNDGLLPLFDVDPSIYIEEITTTNNVSFQHFVMWRPSEKISRLAANSSNTIYFKFIDAPASAINYADIDLRISYKPIRGLFTCMETRRFKINRKSDGTFIWNEYAPQKRGHISN